MTRTMKAVAIDCSGGPEVLQLHDWPVPQIAATEVLIRIDTAGVGIWDAKVRDGSWSEGGEFPTILGVDGSGVVVEVGARVRRLAPGDRVWTYDFGNAKGGFYAEFVAVPSTKVAPIPKTLDLRRAGAAAVIALTALQASTTPSGSRMAKA
jgi:NADPH:quinone reductase-like Zn-dependent oxidoreductase